MGKILQGINKKLFQKSVIINRKKKYNLPPISIFSSDCSGGVLLHDYGLPLDTPTVNLIIEGEDFLKFCRRWEYYLAQPLVAAPSSTYPIALCDDVRIQGVHYHSFDELDTAWNRRKKRVHKDNIVFLFSSRQISTVEVLEQFLSISGKKIVLCPEHYEWVLDEEHFVELHEFEKEFMFSGFSGHRYIDKDFNFADWYCNNQKDRNNG